MCTHTHHIVKPRGVSKTSRNISVTTLIFFPFFSFPYKWEQRGGTSPCGGGGGSLSSLLSPEIIIYPIFISPGMCAIYSKQSIASRKMSWQCNPLHYWTSIQFDHIGSMISIASDLYPSTDNFLSIKQHLHCHYQFYYLLPCTVMLYHHRLHHPLHHWNLSWLYICSNDYTHLSPKHLMPSSLLP